MPMLDGWTNVFQVPGKRTTGDKAQKYAITGPNWKGELPDGVKEYKSPTSMVWILGRTYCTGTPEDYKAVHALQDQYSLVPLSAYGKPYTPPPGQGRSEHRHEDAGARAGRTRWTRRAYFKLLAALMKDNPPAKADAPMVAKMAKIGLVPGKDFDIGKLDPAVAKALAGRPKAGLEKIVAQFKDAGKVVNGWDVFTEDGLYGTDYLPACLRHLLSALAANRTQDAIYPTSEGGRRRQALQRRQQVRDALRQGPAAAGQWLLVADDVRRRVLLRGEPAQPVHAQPAEQAQVQRGRLAGPVHPERIAGQGQGGQLAARPEGQVRPDAAALLAEGKPVHPQRHLEAAGGEKDREVMTRGEGSFPCSNGCVWAWPSLPCAALSAGCSTTCGSRSKRIALKANALADKTDALEEPKPTRTFRILTQAEQATAQLDRHLPRILAQTEKAVDAVNQQLPPLLANADTAVVNLAELSSNLRQYKGLMGVVHNGKQNKDLFSYGASILSLLGEQNAVIGVKKPGPKKVLEHPVPAKQWAAAAQPDVHFLSLIAKSKEDVLHGLARTGSAAPWQIQFADQAPRLLADWIREVHPASKDVQ